MSYRQQLNELDGKQVYVELANDYDFIFDGAGDLVRLDDNEYRINTISGVVIFSPNDIFEMLENMIYLDGKKIFDQNIGLKSYCNSI